MARLSKPQRQLRIAQILGGHAVPSQTRLLELLAAEGVSVTQATLSRDLEELGAVKVRVPGGDSVYAIPEYEPERIAPAEHLQRVLSDWLAEVEHSGTVVVARTPPGCAHVVGSAIDRAGLEGVVGTVAGDDTLLVVADEATGGAGLAERLRQLAGLGPAPARNGRTRRRGPRSSTVTP